MNIKTRLFIIPSTIIALLLFGPPLFATTKANNSLSAALLLSTGTPVPQNEKDKTIDITQQEEIKAVIEQYFDIHYQALSIPPPNFEDNGFGDLTSNISEAIDFEEMEVAKLQLQAEYWKLTSLRYADYQYTLIYDDFSFNQASDRVTVSLRDKSEVIREDSIDQNSKEPNVTGREFGHLFTLHKEEAESE